jgi:pimeloyl-ACP methyl ester carboxylesterase
LPRTWTTGIPRSPNGFAEERDVSFVDYPGIGRSSGQTPSKVAALTNACVAFCGAIGLTRFDVVGFSLGGAIAQQIGAEYPDTIRRMILLGSAPHGGEGLVFDDLSVDDVNDPAALAMKAFFTPSETSQSRTVEKPCRRSRYNMAASNIQCRPTCRFTSCIPALMCSTGCLPMRVGRRVTRRSAKSSSARNSIPRTRPVDLGRLGGDRPVFHGGDQSR